VQDTAPLRLGTATDYFDYVQRNTNVWGWLSSPGIYTYSFDGSNGRVGINTTATIAAQSEIDVNGSTTIGQIIKGAAAQTADLLQIQNSSTDKIMVVSSGGRVGIGTANPSILLHVRGALYSASFPANVEIEDSAAMAQDVGGGFVFSGNDGTTGGRWWAGIRGAKENATSGNYAGYVSILTRTSGVASMTERMRVSSAGNVGIGTTTPTHALTLPSTSTGIALYNTSDQTTNYERARAYWSGNIYTITTEKGGTGTDRTLRLGTIGATFYAEIHAGSANGIMQVTGATGNNTGIGLFVNPTFNTSALIATGLSVAPTLNQSGTAGYTALLINPTENATGTGAKLLIDAQVGGTSKFKVDNTGTVKATGYKSSDGSAGVSGSFTTTDGKTITIKDGLVVSIV
jgi:hypothetical protein